MSTKKVKSPFNEKYYDVGVQEWIGSQGKDISVKSIIIPTYGTWAGPEWAANGRVPAHSTIDWSVLPCRNADVEKNIDPNQCYSLIDAMAKHHDWEYTLAEIDSANEAKLKMEADIELLTNVDLCLLGLGGDTYDCTCGKSNKEGDGKLSEAEIREGQYTLQTTSYAHTSFDAAELKYSAELSVAFTLQLVPDALCTAKEEVVNTFKSIFNYVTGGTNKLTTTDGNQTKTTQKTANGYIVSDYNGENKSESACILDDSAYKEYNAGKIDFGDGGVAAENTFVYGGDGKITINGGTGDDKITMGENDDPTYYTLAGGAGDDSYFLNDGNNYIINDSGENQIYKEDASGGYFSIGDLYKDATDTSWHSADESEQFSQGSDGLWSLTFEDGSTVKLDNFQSGDFGINLINEPTDPSIYNPISLDTEDPNNVDHRDYFWGTSGDDKIIGGAGNDVIITNYQETGKDWLLGGAGNDMIEAFGDPDACILEGDSGVDALIGSYGNDRIFCGTSDYNSDGQPDTMEQIIAYGETAPNLNATGDLAEGCSGNDFIYGSDAKDGLFGGAGDDLLAGGGGDDIIYGDGDSFYIPDNARSEDYWNWSYTIQHDADNQTYTPQFSNINFNSWNYTGGDDVIYAGSGNDFVNAGGGDDEVYGGNLIRFRKKLKYQNTWRRFSQPENLRRAA